MNEMVKVNYDSDTPTVSGRELNSILSSATNFSEFFVIVSRLKTESNLNILIQLRNLLPVYSVLYGVEAITYLIDSVDMETAYEREIVRTRNMKNIDERFLYLISFDDDTIKIGVSQSPINRIDTVSKQAGRKIVDYYIFNTENKSYEVESTIKQKLNPYHLNGEIYKILSRDVLCMLKETGLEPIEI